MKILREFTGDPQYTSEQDKEGSRYYPNLTYYKTDIKDPITHKTIKENVLTSDFYLNYYENTLEED